MTIWDALIVVGFAWAGVGLALVDMARNRRQKKGVAAPVLTPEQPLQTDPSGESNEYERKCITRTRARASTHRDTNQSAPFHE